MGNLTAGEVIGWLISGGALLAVLSTRAAVAELRADLAERQETRCQQCRREFVSRREWDQFRGAQHEG